MTEALARIYFKQIMTAISYIHEHRVSHRDIKPENFVFESTESTNLKLIDFGLSSHFVTDSENHKQFFSMRTGVGTIWYMAPEIFQRSYSEKCDIWSAGVILYIMLASFPPFFGENKNEIKSEIMAQKVSFEGKISI